MEKENGTVYWVTGLSGAGKTTIGTLLYRSLRRRGPAILLDGDQLREIYGDDLGYRPEDRLRMAMRNARLCGFIASQGLDVVCCTIAMFHTVRAWNRAHIPSYREIYLKVSPEVLCRRDQKGLYSGLKTGTSKNVIGADLAFEEPRDPDVVLHNDGDRPPEEVLRILLENLERGGGERLGSAVLG